MDHETTGTVISVARQWWLKINTRAVRMHSMDGAIFPHIATIRYSVDGKDYLRRKWYGARRTPPQVGDTVAVLYHAGTPKKAKIF